MQDIPQEQIDKRFQALTESLQDAIFSERTADAIRKSCVLRETEENTQTIATLAGRVLLGYLRPETFAFEIQKETGIDALKATQVAHDIDTEIFSGVRLELKKLYPPTIQTPTVQAQGFTPRESGTEQKPRPYVVQIPERFRKQEAKIESGIKNQELRIEQQAVAPAAQPEIQEATEPSATLIPEQQIPSPAPSLATPQQNIPPHEAISYKLKVSEGPPMDPIVPLPTFIQSKFKADELGMAGQESGIKNQEAKEEVQDLRFKIQEEQKTQPKANEATEANTANLKSAFGKFTTSSTAPGVAQEPASPYREPVEEQKPVAKVQGKVIDLSRF